MQKVFVGKSNVWTVKYYRECLLWIDRLCQELPDYQFDESRATNSVYRNNVKILTHFMNFCSWGFSFCTVNFWNHTDSFCSFCRWHGWILHENLGCWRSGVITPLIFNLGTRWKREFSFMHKPVHSWEKNAHTHLWLGGHQMWSIHCERDKLCFSGGDQTMISWLSSL